MKEKFNERKGPLPSAETHPKFKELASMVEKFNEGKAFKHTYQSFYGFRRSLDRA